MKLTDMSLIRKIIIFQIVCAAVLMASVGSITVEVGMYYVREKVDQNLLSTNRLHAEALETHVAATGRPIEELAANPALFEKALIASLLAVDGNESVQAVRTYLVNPQGQRVGRAGEEQFDASVHEELLAGKEGVMEFLGEKDVKFIGAYTPLAGSPGWGVVTETDRSEALHAARFSLTLVNAIIGILAGVAVCYVTYLYARRNVAQPVENLLYALQDLHAGEGDLTRRLNKTSRDEVGQMADAFNHFLDKLHGAIRDVVGSIEQLSASALAVRTTAQEVNNVATDQATSVEETSAALEEMSVTISQNAENARTTGHSSSEAADVARSSADVVREAVIQMQAIAENISVIDEIARKTNLLALNAEIEAARAGEHGRGFSVVANEIRKLANQSKEAAAVVGELAGRTSQAAKEAGGMLDGMVPQVIHTAELVRDIANASDEQTAGVEQIALAVSQIETATNDGLRNSEALSQAAASINEQVAQLQQSVAFFRV
jgi:methyl-accepting chemotaxis protein